MSILHSDFVHIFLFSSQQHCEKDKHYYPHVTNKYAETQKSFKGHVQFLHYINLLPYHAIKHPKLQKICLNIASVASVLFSHPRSVSIKYIVFDTVVLQYPGSLRGICWEGPQGNQDWVIPSQSRELVSKPGQPTA